MTRLTTSDRTEALLDQLALDLGAFRAARGAWEPAVILVPNRNLERYLRQGLVRAMGIAANLEFRFLDRFWKEHLPQGLKLLDRPAMQGRLLELLREPRLLRAPELAPLRGYLEGDESGRRLAQLSAQVARLFEEYTLTRPDWMGAWAAGRPASTGGPADTEAWQRRLWKELRGGLDAAWRTLPECFEDPAFGRAAFPPEVFLFGFSQLAQAYHRGFEALGRATELRLYVLNPCEEFWEDVETPGERRRRLKAARGEDAEDPFALGLEDNLALQRWGRPGRENIRLLSELAGWDFQDRFSSNEETSLLHRLQGRIRRREPVSPGGMEADESLRLHACASPRREAEMVASDIWELLQAAPGLRFSDIAVIVPPGAKTEYLDQLRSAFEEAHRIPWVVGDEGSRRSEELLEGAELLLRLPLTDFNRAEVLRVAEHPASGLPVPEGGWAELCGELGIVRDFEHAPDAYLPEDLWSWSKGFRRLALGAFMSLPFEGTEPVAAEEGGDFLAALRGLLSDARRLARQRLPPAAWALLLGRYLGAHLGGDEDASLLARLQKAFGALEALESAGGVAPLPFAAAQELALEALARLRSQSRGLLGQGVVVSSYAPMRAIPFQAVFLLGLGEGVFPGADVRNPLDLRAGRRRAGDVSRAEQDRYLFLEGLLCARRWLRLSYVYRDPLELGELQPSPLLGDLEEMLAPELGPDGLAAIRVRHPVHRFAAEHVDGRAPRLWNPQALREARARALGEALRAGITLPAPAQQVLESLAPAPPPLGTPEPPPRLRLSLGDLARWLEAPLQTSAAKRLGLFQALDEDPAALESEPFETGPLQRLPWLRAAFASGEPLELSQRRLQAAALAPAGPFSDAELEAAEAVLRGWREQLPAGEIQRLRFGREVEAFHWSFELDGHEVRMELQGETPPFVDDGFLLLSDRIEPGNARDRRQALRAWVSHLALGARGLKSPARALVLAATPSESQRWGLAFPSVAEAEAQLRDWCFELLRGQRWPLPVQALFTEKPLPEWIGSLGEEERGFIAEFRGPLPRAWELPVPEDWARAAETRLGAFLALEAEP